MKVDKIHCNSAIDFFGLAAAYYYYYYFYLFIWGFMSLSTLYMSYQDG